MRIRTHIVLIVTFLFLFSSVSMLSTNEMMHPVMLDYKLAQSETFSPSEISVVGTIVDNYANFSYEMKYDNTGSSIDREVVWGFDLQDDIRLSNISIILGNETYWGRAEPEQVAIEMYNESIAMNKTAVLVVSTIQGYEITLNIEAGLQAETTVYVEGLITRNLGIYALDIPIAPYQSIIADFSFDLTIFSHYSDIVGLGLTGLAGFQVSSFDHGVKLEYTETEKMIPALISVQYSLEKQQGGSQLLTYTNGTENFFTYLLAPSISNEDDCAHRQYVFVLDISGSMSGTKIDQAKIAFGSMIDDLCDNDIFNVVAFSDAVSLLWLEPYSATEWNRISAKNWVNSLEAGGSTNFHDAGVLGLGTFNEGDNAKVMLILSDGQPTSGPITYAPDLIAAISEANSQGVSISTIAFGSGADESMMANIAVQNHGFFTFVQPTDDASTKMLDFYQTFATPIAHDYSIVFEGASQICSLQPLGDSVFFNGSEIVISGRFEESLAIDTTIEYVTGTQSYHNQETTPSTSMHHVEYIWAQHRISYLLRMINLEEETSVLENEIISLGLEYGIIVKGYTALILTAYDIEAETSEESTTDTYLPPATTPYPTATGSWGTPPAFFDNPSMMLSLLPLFTLFSVVGILLFVIHKRFSKT